MPSRLIRLSDGTLVETEVEPGEPTQISGGAARKVEATLDRIEPLLVNVCQPITAAWNSITDLHIDHVDVELGISFEGEGNVFISKAKAGANLVVTLSLKKPAAGDG